MRRRQYRREAPSATKAYWISATPAQYLAPLRVGATGGAVGCWIQDHCAIPDGDRRGEPAGSPPATPWVQIVAASMDQTSNTWRALLPMQLGELAAWLISGALVPR
jgi:hypothetical protein